MAGQVLRDRNGMKIGEITIDSSGKHIGRDRNGMKVGEYDPKNNVTRDRNGMKVGSGDMLSSLITSAI